MAGYAAPLRTPRTPQRAPHRAPQRSPQKRIENIKWMVAEIGTQQRQVMHLLTMTFQALYLLFAVTCIGAGIVNEAQGKHTPAVVYGVLGIVLAGIWLFVKVLSKGLKKFVRALKAEMAKVPDEIGEQLGAKEHHSG